MERQLGQTAEWQQSAMIVIRSTLDRLNISLARV